MTSYSSDRCESCGRSYQSLQKHFRFHAACRDEHYQRRIFSSLVPSSEMKVEEDPELAPIDDCDQDDPIVNVEFRDCATDLLASIHAGDLDSATNKINEEVNAMCGISNRTQFRVAHYIKAAELTITKGDNLIRLLKEIAPDNEEIQSMPQMRSINKQLDTQLSKNRELGSQGICFDSIHIPLPNLKCFEINSMSSITIAVHDPTYFICEKLTKEFYYDEVIFPNIPSGLAASEEIHGYDDLNTGDALIKMTKRERIRYPEYPNLQVLGLLISGDDSEKGKMGQGRIRSSFPVSWTVSILPRLLRNKPENKSLLCYGARPPVGLRGNKKDKQ